MPSVTGKEGSEEEPLLYLWSVYPWPLVNNSMVESVNLNENYYYILIIFGFFVNIY
jgi:hypothetical protein